MKYLSILLALAMSLSLSAKKEKQTTIDMLTSKGRIVLRLYNETPQHRDNFVKLAKEGYFNDLLFHRVIEDFMIQGGDPNSRDAAPGALLGEGDPGYTLPAEIHLPTLHHKRGALAAAREGDDVNPEMRSSGSQFYIVWGKRQTTDQIENYQQSMRENSDWQFEVPDNILGDYEKVGGTPWLDGAYTVFGEVTDGLETVEKIQNVRTDRHDRPKTDVRIVKAEVIREHL